MRQCFSISTSIDETSGRLKIEYVQFQKTLLMAIYMNDLLQGDESRRRVRLVIQA